MRVLRWLGAVCSLGGVIAYLGVAIALTLLVILPYQLVRGAVRRTR